MSYCKIQLGVGQLTSTINIPKYKTCFLMAVIYDYWRGPHSLASGQYPSSGGTGIGGIPYPGNVWYVSEGGNLNVDGIGVTPVSPKAKLTYVGGDVTLPSSWIVTQN